MASAAPHSDCTTILCPMASSRALVSGDRAKGSTVIWSGSHWWWMRGAFTASWIVIPCSITLSRTWTSMVMMREPPGEPITMKGLPSRVTMVGLMELKGRLPGAMALALPCTSPKRLGVPGLMVKSSISPLRKKPVSPAMTFAPNSALMV